MPERMQRPSSIEISITTLHDETHKSNDCRKEPPLRRIPQQVIGNGWHSCFGADNGGANHCSRQKGKCGDLAVVGFPQTRNGASSLSSRWEIEEFDSSDSGSTRHSARQRNPMAASETQLCDDTNQLRAVPRSGDDDVY